MTIVESFSAAIFEFVSKEEMAFLLPCSLLSLIQLATVRLS